jgi:MA3 domain
MVSSQVQQKKSKQLTKEQDQHKDKAAAEAALETTVKEGTAKRNIHRKKTEGTATGNYDSRNKKQGGHGKGEWKEHLDPLDPDYRAPVDKNDPLYDEAEQGYILTTAETNGDAGPRGYDPIESRAIYGPMLTLSEFKIQVAECVKEFFDSGDADEVIRTLLELSCQEYHREIVKKAISLAMDKGPRERELTSRLLTSLHPTPMSDQDMELGFEILLDSLDDLRTDVPDADVSGVEFDVTQSHVGALITIEKKTYCANISLAPFYIFAFWERPWWHPSWHEPSLTRSCRPPFCRTKTTLALEIP